MFKEHERRPQRKKREEGDISIRIQLSKSGQMTNALTLGALQKIWLVGMRTKGDLKKLLNKKHVVYLKTLVPGSGAGEMKFA